MNTKVALVVIGDMHVVPSELEECQRVIDLVAATGGVLAKDHEVRFLFLGDQHDTWGLVQSQVTSFWLSALKQLLVWGEVWMLKGNHDQNDLHPNDHALLPYKEIKGVHVVDQPQSMLIHKQVIVMAPFYPDPKVFEKELQEFAEQEATLYGLEDPVDRDFNYLFCHQTFQDALFENGFQTKDGVDSVRLAHYRRIVSGHIHRAQSFGKVEYLGAPRWRHVDDAQMKERFITTFVIEPDQEKISERLQTPTSPVCRKIVRCEDVEGQLSVFPEPFLKQEDYRLYVHIKGSRKYIENQSKYWKTNFPSVKLNSTRVEKRDIKVRESMGVQAAFRNYIDNQYKPQFTTHEKLKKRLEKLFDAK